MTQQAVQTEALPVELADGRVPLRLIASRGALGVELYEPVEVGPIEIRHLSTTLPGLRFPIDLSGGVPVFRHRRGDLERLDLASSLLTLGRWLTPRLTNVLGAPERPVTAWGIPRGIALGLSGARGALAFDLLWAPLGSDARFVVANARGARLDAPALAHALHVVDSALGSVGERRGRLLVIPRLAQRLTRAVLPAVGARAPATDRVRFSELHVEGDEVSLALDSAFEPPALHATAARALELALLTEPADTALASGDLDRARAGYVAALESAPRHPELARLVAEIDVLAGGRAEAALGLVVETIPATHSGAIGAELLARSGDLDGAREAIGEMARHEPFAPVCGLLWLRLSELCEAAPQKVEALNLAVASAPSLAVVRWARFDARLELGDIEGALADAEHLEAAAAGALNRHVTCTRAARELLTRGFVKDAGRWFERALRYLPDDAAATAGLARSLMEAGKGQRAFALLARAVALSERQGRADADALIDMARLLATDLSDLPQAIARVRQVPASSARAVEAAYLEGDWRASLGDIAGATLAYARMRDRIELGAESHEPGEPGPQDELAVDWLMQAARFEREVQRDVLSAERHLAVALRVAPRHRALATAYREVAAIVAARARRERGRGAETAEPEALDTSPPPPGSMPPLGTIPPVGPDRDG